jgi:hypothetical protein
MVVVLQVPGRGVSMSVAAREVEGLEEAEEAAAAVAGAEAAMAEITISTLVLRIARSSKIITPTWALSPRTISKTHIPPIQVLIAMKDTLKV